MTARSASLPLYMIFPYAAITLSILVSLRRSRRKKAIAFALSMTSYNLTSVLSQKKVC
jgi:hypothetical protein